MSGTDQPAPRLSPPERLVRAVAVGTLIVGGFFPFIWMVLTSLKSEGELQTFPVQYLPSSMNVGNYARVFSEQPFATFFTNSLIVSVLSTALCIACAVPAAYALARLHVRARGVLMTGVVAFSMFPVVSLLVPLFRLFRGAELLNTYPALILPYAALSLPVAILTLVAFFSAIPRDLEAAAMVDGTDRVGAMLRVVLPLSAPGVVTAALLVFVNSWNEFLLALSFNTRLSMRTVSVGVTLYQGEFAFPWPLIAAAVVVATVPIVLLIAVFQRRFVAGLTAGGVKA
ncbi:multiple sugar transport system permease protein [Deinococcus metalli]|uniref:Multiple sugar transport system permease protein n=1 Tax=Deinococcus metalli TaxID=1141878 RepID=A0A7W8KB77_9DEIO|nr:carbohydrate ABC transporter permease [Deinococcus metalli]MBB5375017.1 multiple sugar transport system permease protein [Deinococcus metalli]GHF32055.1 sugar ABC transporter permease [Deinococcus metalli]